MNAGMKMRDRDASSVRVDATRTAIRKAMSGCADCASGYFALARSRGASRREIEQEIATASSDRISRRRLMKLAFAASVTATAMEFQRSSGLATTAYGPLEPIPCPEVV